ncbi:MAG: AraC family transcriptional regulator [Phycisphaeraceae bacterium]
MAEIVPHRLPRSHVFDEGRVPVVVRRIRVGGADHPHDHDFMEIQLVVGGRGRHWTTEGVQPVKRGDTFVIRPGAWHAYRDTHRLDVYVCCFGAELLRREMVWLLDDPALGYLFWSGPMAMKRRGIVGLHLPDAPRRRACAHLEGLRRATTEDRPERRAEVIGRLLMLFGELARSMGPAHRAASEARGQPHPAVVEALRLFEQDVAHPWTLNELARQVHLEPSYLVRVFKAHTGLPPMTQLARYRAERAAALLLSTERPIGEIGNAVGWDDPNYFARRFRAHFGVSASAYRRRFQQGGAV